MISSRLFSQNSSPAQLAGELKGKCVQYVTERLEDDFWQSESGRELSETAEIENATKDGDGLEEGSAWIRHMDNFILFGETEDGQRVLDAIIAHAKLTAVEKVSLEAWRERAFASIFAIKEIATDTIHAMDVLAEVNYKMNFSDVIKGRGAVKSMPVGSFVQTNILPVNHVWFFSGVQTVLPKGSEPLLFETCIAKASARQAFRNNPEKLQWALETQKEYYQVFIDLFGADELIVPTEQAQGKLQEYYDTLAAHFSQSDNMIVPELSLDF